MKRYSPSASSLLLLPGAAKTQIAGSRASVNGQYR
jgi:hypothetical protein